MNGIIIIVIFGILVFFMLKTLAEDLISPCYLCEEDKRKCPKCIYNKVEKKHSNFVARKEKNNDNN